MNDSNYIPILQNLADKLESVRKVGLSASRIHDINIDLGLCINTISNIEYYIKKGGLAIEQKTWYDNLIKRIEDDLIEFVKW